MRASWGLGALVLASGFVVGTTGMVRADPGQCQTGVWTTATDFAGGYPINVHTVGSADAATLEVNNSPVPLHYVWVARSGGGTIVRIDTANGAILGEYRSAPDGKGSDPSRTTVDATGCVWAGNRGESGEIDPYGNKGSVVKIGLVIGGARALADGTEDPNGQYIKSIPGNEIEYCTCADRDRDGMIKTSWGLGNVLPWNDYGDWLGGWQCGEQGGPALVEDAEDECILVYQRVNGYAVRHVSVDEDNRVWVGGVDNDAFDLLAGETGEIIAGFVGPSLDPPITGGYGGLVSNGVIWSATPGEEDPIMRYDTKQTLAMTDDQWQNIDDPFSQNRYGLAVDKAGGIWCTRWTQNTVAKYDALGNLLFVKSTGGASNDRGVAIRPQDGSVWVANSAGTSVSRLDSNGDSPQVIELAGVGCVEPTGVAIDAEQKTWVTCRGAAPDRYGRVLRINPATNQVDLPPLELGLHSDPYNYSDMTGMQALMSHKYGTWTGTRDSGVAGARWSRVTWNEGTCPQPDNTSISVQLRAADTEMALTREVFVDMPEGVARYPALTGRFVQARVILHATGYDASFGSPVLCDLTVHGDANDGRECNNNGTPDSCEFDDCNGNCQADAENLANRCDDDCNENGIPDGCDVAGGTSLDADTDGTPDECENIIFVDVDAGGNNNGVSWTDAYTDLQNALADAAQRSGRTRIWVAEGTYRPDCMPTPCTGTSGDRYESFELLDCVSIFGGFSGTESDLMQRDLKNHKSILSGDLNNDDHTGGSNTENSLAVVDAAGANTTAVLDGFVITAGTGAGGAGLDATLGGPTIRRCAFLGNSADWGGAANFAWGRPTLEHCLFIGNHADWEGGALEVGNARLRLINCTFAQNTCADLGGAVAIYPNADLVVRNCVFGDNTAPHSTQFAQAYGSGSLRVAHSDVQGGAAGIHVVQGGSLTVAWGPGNIGDDPQAHDPQFADTDGPDDDPNTFDDNNLRLASSGSPCVDAGDDDAVPHDVTIDLDGGRRIFDGDGDGVAAVDMGAYEWSTNLIGAAPPDQGTLWRTAKNIIRLTFDHELTTAPTTGQLLIQELLPSGQFGSDLSSGFTFTIDTDPKVLKIRENATSLTHRKWFAIRNIGGLSGVTDFEVQYVVLMGDVDDNGFVQNLDAGAIYPNVSPLPRPDDYRFDVDGNGFCQNLDAGNVFPKVSPLPKPTKPTGHEGCGGGGDMMMGGGGESMSLLADGATADQPTADDPADGAWTYAEAGLTLEVTAVGGQTPLTVLAPHTTYELHYAAGSEHVNIYVLFAVGAAAEQGFAQAAPPAAGEWSATGNFTFVDLSADAVPAPGYPADLFRTQMAFDYVPPEAEPAADAVGYAGPTGTLCTFTTGAAGVLNLDLYLDWLDFTGRHDVAMHAQAEYVVRDVAVDDGAD